VSQRTRQAIVLEEEKCWLSTDSVTEYLFRCPGCRLTFVTLSRTDIPRCQVCNTDSKRVYSFNPRLSIPEHFNYSVGAYVTNERTLRDAFKEQSDNQSERTGIEHSFEFLTRSEMADPSAHGVTGEGLDDTYRTRFDDSVQ
jgi:hypothetical protein